MKHKISPAEATAITKLAVALQPGWDSKKFLSKLADVREQHDFPEFMAQLTQCALAGLMIEEALAPVVSHECPVSVVEQTSRRIDEHEAWLNGAAAVVNEDDITKSVLRKRKKTDSNVVRPPSEDPTHWRNRFAANIEQGKREREELLQQSRAQQLPEQTSHTQSATAAAAHHSQRPDQPETSPLAAETVPNQQAYSWGPDDFEDYHDR